jgi:hypothetical protein
MSNRVIITQSNYIPWKGYFTSMRKATHFVIYDDAQYTKRDWRNRNKIITQSGPSWLSIPIDVKGKFHQKINEAKINNHSWNVDHWNKIEHSYRKSPFYQEYSKHFKDLYLKELKNVVYLTDVNNIILKKCIALLGIDIQVLDSREFDIRGGKTEKLINICNDLQAKEYFTGPAAKGYIEEDLFMKNNIKLSYYDLENFPVYQQKWDGFDHKVSILDMFFNLGDDTIKYFN